MGKYLETYRTYVAGEANWCKAVKNLLGQAGARAEGEHWVVPRQQMQ